MATRLRPWAIVPVNAVLRTPTALSHGSLPVCAYTGRAARNISEGMAHLRHCARNRRKGGRRMGRVICIAAPFVCISGEWVLSVATSGAKVGENWGRDYYFLRRIIPSESIIQRHRLWRLRHTKKEGAVCAVSARWAFPR